MAPSQVRLLLIIGHAFWDPGRSKLLFWCESTDLFFSSGTKKLGDFHPFALLAGELRNASLSFSGSTIAFARKADILSLLIPSLKGRPLPSDAVPSGHHWGDAVRLAAWKVPCLSMPPDQALAFLTNLRDDIVPPIRSVSVFRILEERIQIHA